MKMNRVVFNVQSLGSCRVTTLIRPLAYINNGRMPRNTGHSARAERLRIFRYPSPEERAGVRLLNL
jgi:hypothetical protein